MWYVDLRASRKLPERRAGTPDLSLRGGLNDNLASTSTSPPPASSPLEKTGIFGFYFYDVRHTKKEILDTLFDGLKRLEYRGYGAC